MNRTLRLVISLTLGLVVPQAHANVAGPNTLYCTGGTPDPRSAPDECHREVDPLVPGTGGVPYGGDNVP